jgi:hypothetical protein
MATQSDKGDALMRELAGAVPRFVQSGGLGSGIIVAHDVAQHERDANFRRTGSGFGPARWDTEVKHIPISPEFPEATTTTAVETEVAGTAAFPFQVVPTTLGGFTVAPGKIENTVPNIFGTLLTAVPPPQMFVTENTAIYLEIHLSSFDASPYYPSIMDLNITIGGDAEDFRIYWDDAETKLEGYAYIKIADVTVGGDGPAFGITNVTQWLNMSYRTLFVAEDFLVPIG